uniref:Uncharacterized protein n=1 Tax=Octopus bimaculoides TaxID=37653 RepID=A0A0L8HMC8_OCTBM
MEILVLLVRLSLPFVFIIIVSLFFSVDSDTTLLLLQVCPKCMSLVCHPRLPLLSSTFNYVKIFVVTKPALAIGLQAC